METLKILVVSQKGGVGKSTLSTNLAAWFGEIKKQRTTLIDFDPHASSSVWLNHLNPKNVFVNNAVISDFSAQRWYIGARTVIRKMDTSSNIIIADVTWTSGMNSSFMREFDLVIVPTSVSSIDLEATNEFISKNLTKSINNSFTNSRLNQDPSLMLLPSMVTNDQMRCNPFAKEYYSFSFLLLPPIPLDPEIRKLFKNNFIHNTTLKIKDSYEVCFESIYQAGKLHLRDNKFANSRLNTSLKINKTNNPNVVLSKEVKTWSTNSKIKDVKNVIPNFEEQKKLKTNKRKKTWIQRISLW
ncbi:MAG: hypothetical protein CBD16_08060 [Betaproteobacteria bacterium TMED156]|nr:MAG: hypothetical protein CBD16_08060 [Betaproteobacteria bacterium TMED156]